MKNELASGAVDLVGRIGELAKVTQELARDAARQYSAEVEFILKAQICDSGRIERCLDGMLDFCFDEEVLALYKRLCRYYFAIDPEATAFYVNAYREMWDEQESNEGPLDGETRHTGRATLDKESGTKRSKG
jgi:hypothetical protein